MFTSTDALNRFAVNDNAPNWRVDIPINVLDNVIELTDVKVVVESFSTAGATKVGVTHSFAPANRVTLSLLNNAGQPIVAGETEGFFQMETTKHFGLQRSRTLPAQRLPPTPPTPSASTPVGVQAVTTSASVGSQ